METYRQTDVRTHRRADVLESRRKDGEHLGISVVVPVYNSENSLAILIARLHPVMQSLASEFEVLLVDDGSADSSWRVIAYLASHLAWIRGIRLMRNYGQHNALLCGIREARYPIVITLDDDLQNPPEEIPALVGKITEGFDLVYGTPPRQRHGILRDAASYVTKLALQSTMGAETARNVSAFRAFRKQVTTSFASYGGSFVSIDVLLTWGTTRVTAIPVRQDARVIGSSQYTVTKLARHAVNMITGFSAVPLQLATLLGFACAVLGVAALLFVISRYLLQGTSVPGFPFLASLVAIFSGAQMFALGVMGEYLARMHFRLMDRPPYSVRAVLEKDRPA
jgi:undecaprenyl-phosphate 4-deoxy-4-formamido-L-arabinose transferase